MSEKKKLRFNTVVVSDSHLGKGAASAEFLLEFLQNMQCKRLILAGDILDGWRLKAQKRKPFPEMHARCIDAINAHAASGIEVIYLRGNHDEDLAKSKYKLMRKTVEFSDKKNIVRSAITFAKSFVHIDAKGKKHLVIHGDVFDNFQKHQGKKRIAKIADSAYENLVNLNRVFKRAVMNSTGMDVSPASYLKNATKEVVGVIDSFERSVAKDSITKRFDGVICGHIHHAEIRNIGDCVYMNSGDWVESCKCLVENENGDWSIVDWAKERKNLGLGRPPIASDTNPVIEFRPITERQLSLVRRVWPGRDYSELLAMRREHKKNINELEHKIVEHFELAGSDNAKLMKRHKKIVSYESELATLTYRLQPYPHFSG